MRDRPKGVRLIQLRSHDYSELRLATLEMERGHYLDFTALMALVSHQNRDRLWTIVRDNVSCFRPAKGSSSNHQAWEGGYLDHIAETMNIACQLYNTLNNLRRLPFSLSNALEVMFLHDIEKPFRDSPETITPLGVSFKQYVDNAYEAWDKSLSLVDKAVMSSCAPGTRINLKAIRRQFRTDIIEKYGIMLTPAQENALHYVEGVPDDEYTPNERMMGKLAAFCHSCDILSARLWYDKGQLVPAPAWE